MEGSCSLGRSNIRHISEFHLHFRPVCYKLLALPKEVCKLNIFNYDSKFMQVMLVLADLIIMNVLFVLCSLPIVTIGAAQAGLFTGISVLMNKEDDSSCAKAFFRGFRNGFGRITLLHTVIFVLVALALWTLVILLVFQQAGMNAPVWMCIVAICLLLVYHAMLAPFHATFDCKLGLLAKNVLLMVLAHPIQCVVIAALMVLPFALLLSPLVYYVLGGIIVFLAIYYSLVYLIAYSLLKKPFQKVKDNFKAAQDAAAIPSPAEEVTADKTEETV